MKIVHVEQEEETEKKESERTDLGHMGKDREARGALNRAAVERINGH